MIHFKPLIATTLVLTLNLSSFHLNAFAGTKDIPITPKQRVAMKTTLRDLSKMDKKTKSRLFNLKNHKGEDVFRGGGTRHPVKEGNLWATLDPEHNEIEGTSTEKVYKKFKIPRKNNEVIVAVIDGGIDIQHEDLKGHIWENETEVNGIAGVDDDKNGYVDDFHGWNFLGNKDGRNVDGMNLEVTRIYAKLKKKMDSGEAMTDAEKALYAEVSEIVEAGIQEATLGFKRYQAFDAAFKVLFANGLKEETLAGLDAVTSTDPDVLNAKKLVTIVLQAGRTSEDIKEGLAHFTSELSYGYNPDFNSSDIVGDNPNVLNEVGYGNNDVTGPDAHHGTHVAGIIAANRLNSFGIDGQALNVKIMCLRAVPNGDERDKDVANAVRYAADHGARIINMSFGKAYSPDKPYVDAAMRYAEANGVILVHAAGNDNKNTESRKNNFPNALVGEEVGLPRLIKTWIEVGASAKNKGMNLVADFSNYGKTSVDVFAPGKDIVSTIPGNKYASFNGTSMASPEVSGVAALLLEKYPFASALEVRDAILSTTNQYPGLQVALPGTAEGTAELIEFKELSATGGTVNAFKAMEAMKNL